MTAVIKVPTDESADATSLSPGSAVRVLAKRHGSLHK
jgi:hypothetical protein